MRKPTRGGVRGGTNLSLRWGAWCCPGAANLNALLSMGPPLATGSQPPSPSVCAKSNLLSRPLPVVPGEPFFVRNLCAQPTPLPRRNKSLRFRSRTASRPRFLVKRTGNCGSFTPAGTMRRSFCLGRRSWLGGQRSIHDHWSCPYGSSMAIPLPPWLAKLAESWPE